MLNFVCPLLDDPRLTMPDVKVAGPLQSLSRGAGAVRGFFGNLGVRAANTGAANRAAYTVAKERQAVAPVGLPDAMHAELQKHPTAPADLAAPVGKPDLSSHLANLSGRRAAGIGAAGLALKGWVDPGKEYDEYGHEHTKSRLSSALSGAVTGAGAGFLAAPLIRGGSKLHQSMPTAPVAPKTAEQHPVLHKPNVPGAAATGNGIAAGKAAEASSEPCTPCKEVDPKLNKHAEEPLPYKVPSLSLKK